MASLLLVSLGLCLWAELLITPTYAQEGSGCTSQQFECDNGSCIELYYTCDWDDDCTDGSDEFYCNSNCSDIQFQCGSGRCISGNWQCDGEEDCTDGSDEANCDWCKSVGGVHIGSQSQCLIFNVERKNWNDAAAACASKGGQLASLANNPQEVLSYIVTNYGRKLLWAGGSDIAREGTWVWSNGEPFDTHFPWADGEPNNFKSRSEDCLQVYGRILGSQRGTYNDAPCDLKYGSICELGGFGGRSSGGGGGPVVRILADNRDGPHADGSYSFNFELEDGTSVQEQGYPTDSGTVAQEGSYKLTYPDGTVGEFKWIADENGFRVESPLLPTPPPIPPHAQVV